MGVLCLANLPRVLELSPLGFKALPYMVFVAMIDVLVLNTRHIVGVLFWEDLLVLNRLH